MPLPTYCECRTHSQAAVIDEELLAGERVAVLADAYGVPIRDLSAHRSQHLREERGRVMRPLEGQERPAELEKVRR